MKVSKEQIKQIIKEQLEEEFGKSAQSAADRSKELRTQASDSQGQKGIDNSERGIMKQFNDRLQKLAQLSNIRSGSINSILKKVYAMMDKEIENLENSNQQKQKE